MNCSLVDIENEIPFSNLRLSQGFSELRVKTTQKTKEGFTETTTERLSVQKNESDQQKKICITRPFNRSRPITNTICLSVEDVKLAKYVDSNECWEVYRSLFRRVLVYGKVVVLNQFSKDDKTCFKFSIDDGSDVVIATMNISKEAKQAGEKMKLLVDRVLNYLFNFFQFQIKQVDLLWNGTSSKEKEKLGLMLEESFIRLSLRCASQSLKASQSFKQ